MIEQPVSIRREGHLRGLERNQATPVAAGGRTNLDGRKFPILVHDAPGQPDDDPGRHENGGEEQKDLPLVAVDAHLSQLSGIL